jgi:P-type Ca2+ transporter type 2C
VIALTTTVSEERFWHALDPAEAISALESNKDSGLTDDQAISKATIYGPNVLETGKRASAIQVFFHQFSNLLIGILLLATVISAALGEIVDALVIFVIVLFAVILGFFQEFRAERALEALKKMLSPTSTVIRGGIRKEIPASQIVPGDLLLLEAGEKVDADARLVESFNLQMNEASLTGESAPVMKVTGKLAEASSVADRLNIAFAGTTVVQGRAKALVIGTGSRTEFGKIATEVAAIETEETPLERRMKEIGEKLGRVALAVVTIVALGGLLEEFVRTGTVGIDFIVRIFLFAVALAVAAIPEALPAIVTGSLAIGMHTMAKRNAIVRKMPAVETLGATQVICTDKTGTLTRGEMTVRQLYLAGRKFEVTGKGYEPIGEIRPSEGSQEPVNADVWTMFANASLLCSDALLIQEGGEWVVKGDTTEGALVALAEKVGVRQNEVRNLHPRMGEISFTSERKRLTTIHVEPNGRVVAYMKGAPDVVLPLCSAISENGKVRELREDGRATVLSVNEEMAQSALRVIAVAEKTLPSIPKDYSEQSIESGFTFLGLAGIIDPPRQEAIEAVRTAKAVGMKPIMITGDHKLTALAIAKETGIYEENDLVLTGNELDALRDEEFEEKVERITVYARVSPGHKLKIVDAWKKKGKVVAMTGDGINDAPALKKADIGIAMGITGTDVAKEAADLVLADDNFATIVKAIELGRWIYENVKKYLAYLLQANFVEIAVITLASLIVLPLTGAHAEGALPLLAVQILYINLATDGLPAIALGLSPPDADLMKRPPRPREESVFTREVVRFIVLALIVQTPILIFGFVTGLPDGLVAARSRLFLMFIGVELAIALNCQSLRNSVLETRPHRWLVIAVLWEVFLIVMLLLFPPARNVLGMVLPTSIDLMWIVGAVLAAGISMELVKKLTKLR